MSFGNKQLDAAYDRWITQTPEEYYGIDYEDLDLLIIKRVSYGKDKTIKKDREYTAQNLDEKNYSNQVGTIDDWTNIAKLMKFEGLKIIEKDNNIEIIKFEELEE